MLKPFFLTDFSQQNRIMHGENKTEIRILAPLSDYSSSVPDMMDWMELSWPLSNNETKPSAKN